MEKYKDYTFEDTEFMTAKEKVIVLKQWVTFVKNGYKIEHFKKRLYNHIISHCEHIAHYNSYGFYDVWFKNTQDRRQFIVHLVGFTQRMSKLYYKYTDINNAMLYEYQKLHYKEVS